MKKRLDKVEIFEENVGGLFIIRLWYNCKVDKKRANLTSLLTKGYTLSHDTLKVKDHGIINLKKFRRSFDRKTNKIEFILKSKYTYDGKSGNYT